MPFSFEDKLVIAVSTRALFDLEEENKIFKTKGLKKYREEQRKRENRILKKGTAFPLVEKLLKINSLLGTEATEVVLVSNNDADTAIRIFNSIQKYKLKIIRATFTNGAPKFKYLNALHSKLYLSASQKDVRDAINQGFAAAHVIHKPSNGDKSEKENIELKIGFDFDGVLVDDSSEAVYQKNKDLNEFISHENINAKKAHEPGPILSFMQAIGRLRKIAEEKSTKNVRPVIRTAIITARDARAVTRLVKTVREKGLIIDETFLLGGATKAPFVESFAPDIYFDDQLNHLIPTKNIATAYVPYGIINQPDKAS